MEKRRKIEENKTITDLPYHVLAKIWIHTWNPQFLLAFRDAKKVFHPRYINTYLAKTTSMILNGNIENIFLTTVFDWICMLHRFDLVKLLNLDQIYKDSGIFYAARSNDYVITKYLIDHGFNRGGALCGAADGGHLKLLIYLQPTRDDLDDIFPRASWSGHTHILRHFYGLYPDYEIASWCIVRAASNGHVDTCKWLSNNTPFNRRCICAALYYATWKQHTEIITFLTKLLNSFELEENEAFE